MERSTYNRECENFLLNEINQISEFVKKLNNYRILLNKIYSEIDMCNGKSIKIDGKTTKRSSIHYHLVYACFYLNRLLKIAVKLKLVENGVLKDVDIESHLVNLIDNSNNIEKGYLAIEEAAIYLSIPKSYLYKLTAGKRIPCYRPTGKKIYFKKSDLDEWMNSARIDAKKT